MNVFCRATLNYASGPVEVEILDARDADLPGWEVCGFELVGHRSRLTGWEDDDEIVAAHYPEAEALARGLTGCDHAMVTGHIKRDPAQAARHRDFAPIKLVHSDFARGYDDVIRAEHRRALADPAVAVSERHAAMADAVEHARRLVVLQFWRNLGPPKMDLPLALCDARTVNEADTRPVVVDDYAGGGGHFEALVVNAPAEPGRHQWYAFPEMTAAEAIAFRTYDSDIVAAGGTYFTPHAAFRDPSVPLGEPARSSIELRATCLFL